ncbi:MAG: FAD-binding oxidoreductase [Candidatus Vogelbacteria bacterium]|nr:FAD-binding oxidoreductase [Candidatus Vogelbacteria bacterium]
MKVAVIGGGIYGVTVAARLAKRGHEVELFEEKNDILQTASGINQYRLHRGYHYPRSAETIVSSLAAEPTFRAEYGAAVIDANEHYYAIAKEKSLISRDEYLEICKRHGLEHEIARLDLLDHGKLQLCLRVQEAVLDPSRLRSICWHRLRESGVRVICGQRAAAEDVAGHDYVVNCTYANLNALMGDQPERQRDYQFELCEKPVVRLPAAFAKKSVVVLDGPFTCIDPVGEGSLHVMGNVVHAIHSTNIGKHPNIPNSFHNLLNRGVIIKPTITNFNKFMETATYFMPAIKDAEHIGSMFTVRTVLPNVEQTDTRPTLVDAINHRLINVFSGKIGNCVLAADRVAELIESRATVLSSAKV